MIQTGFDTRIKIQDIIENQLPGFILQESPLTSDFLKQYYVSQEFQSGPVDLADNLDQYLKLDNLTPEVVVGNTNLVSDISSTSGIITVTSTKGYPQKYGLVKIDNEIITYTGISANTFTGCVRGFSGITSYHSPSNPEELVFSTSNQESHSSGALVYNLSSLFLKEFYKKIKYTFTPGLENTEFVNNLNIGNFIKSAKSFYQSKGTKESFRILFNILYGVTPTVVNLSDLLLRPSSAEYSRREEVIAELISGDASKLVGQTITKSTDPNTYASVSQAEILTINGKVYYKLSLFVGYNDTSAVVGTFTIPGKTKVIENTLSGSSIISVDSTIGFSETGTLISGTNRITYSSKSINQFYGCSGIINTINAADDIRSDETIFGYENGDIKKRVDLRITGVLSDFVQLSDVYNVNEGDKISVNNLGEIITNPSSNKTYEQIFANSWVYNTSSRYQVSAINGSTFTLLSPIDKSSLKVGDNIEILKGGTQIVVSSSTNIPYVNSIDLTNNQITVSNNDAFVPNINLQYDIRRKLNKASSTGIAITGGNNALISDIQNLFIDDSNSNDVYVASNGLPSYTIAKNLIQYSIPNASGSPIDSANGSGNLQGYDPISQQYSIIAFTNNVPFVNGDKIYYQPSSSPIPGLTQQSYYVEVLSSQNKIRLYNSRSFIGSGSNYVGFSTLYPGTGSHNFILNGTSNNYISSQKLLKKFNLSQNIQNGTGQLTPTGSIGMLINGVEIENYKSNDKIYYGPLDSVQILNGGNNYDVINPPVINVNNSSGTTALIQPVISGSVQKVLVDPQTFDLNTVVSIGMTGGNGTGAVFSPIIIKRRREILFDARQLSIYYGGIDINNETISFLTNHNLNTGDSVIYDSNGNLPIGIGTFSGSNVNQNSYLVQNATYYVSVINNVTIQLYNSQSNAISGINTIGFTTSNTSGYHKFKSGVLQNAISEIKVINGGSGYTNRQLIVKTVGISTINNTVYFKNHGFNEKDLIVYNYQTTPITGLTTTNQYYVSRVDDNYFKLCDAGIGGTNINNYTRSNFVKFSGIGSGYQYFSYPPISLLVTSATVGVGSTSIKYAVGVITATPIVRGSIIDAYLYEPGTDYGSKVINLHAKPNISILTGSGAKLSPVVINGQVTSVNILYGGTNYYSVPDIIINGSGTGAVIRPVISNGQIVKAIVVNSGLGYTTTNISAQVISPGSNALFTSNVRSLTVNNNFKYGDEILKNTPNNLEYCVSGYFDQLRQSFNDGDQTKHSPIIGWAYDGNPIYGPFGYSDSQNTSSSIKILTGGYQLNYSSVYNRPSGFNAGFFADDYTFTNSGDLDQNNGRFTKTPDFPNGVYAYFAGVTTSSSLSSLLVSSFPYFIGNTYKSNFITDNLLIDQSFNFKNSKLIRNTFPYKLNDLYASNDFIIESSDKVIQQSIVNSVSKGSVNGFNVVSGGTNYKVGDQLQFDNTGTNGGGLSAVVSSVNGVGITSIFTNIQTYNNSLALWQDGNTIKVIVTPYHNLSDADNVVVSGFSTNLGKINGLYSIGVTSYYASTAKYIPSTNVGIVTDIYLSQIPQNISIGSSILIGNEILSVLNIFKDQNVIRANRSISGYAYSTSSVVQFIPDSFTIQYNSSFFDSKRNDIVFFNPLETVGYGVSAGVSTSTTFAFSGVTTYSRSIPSQSIYLENHPFSNNQQVILSIPDTTYSPLSISTSFGSTPFNLPIIGISTVVYVTNKSGNTIGIKTNLNSSEVYFAGIGSTTNSYLYSIRSLYNQVTSNVQKIKTTVSTAATNNLSNGDVIDLTVKPNLSVGIGTSSSVYVKYDPISQKILINPIGFSSTGINTSNNNIFLANHNLNTGDKVLYSANDLIASGLSTGSYFVYKIDSNTIQLCQTYYDSQLVPPTIVSIASSGGSNHSIGPINPQISSVKNNNLVFNLSDKSLSGYKLRIYYDNNFTNEFVSVGNTNTFNISGVGTVGVSTNASLTLKYTSGIPNSLFYTLEKSGFISTSDTDVKNRSKILFTDSVYNGTFNISGIGSTSFNISLVNTPENLSYTASQCNTLSYSTNSPTAYGAINKVRIISGGLNYKKLPLFIGVGSSQGTGAFITPKSKTIGNVKNISIINEGFEYASDNTLKPTAYISPSITLKNSNTISNIVINYGGNYYIYPPNLIIVDGTTGKQVNTGILKANLSSSSINSVDIIQNPKGLGPSNRIVSINNTNGLSVNTVYSSSSGVVTCLLTTPILGFSTYSPPIFSIGDQIFVEGIQKYGNSGTGFNSADYNYTFFTVTNATSNASIPFQIEYNISGLTTNPGIAKTSQESLPNIIKYQNYPQFTINQTSSSFNLGEKLLVSTNGVFNEVDLSIAYYGNNTIKVFGSYNLSSGVIIQGKSSGTIATIDQIQKNYGRFNVNYSTPKNYGWANDVGKLDQDNQSTSDNDYYQDLAYTVKSPIQFKDLITPVNNLLHTTGLKNFADVGITSSSSHLVVGINSTIVRYDIIDENRVDTINNFDTVVDYNSTNGSSNFIKFNNKQLTSYIDCITNRVLNIDDISSQFSSLGLSASDQNKILQILSTQTYNRFIVQAVDTTKSQFQLTELIVLNDNLNSNLFKLEKGTLYNQPQIIGDVSIYTDPLNNSYLEFNPTDPYNYDYDIKILQNNFSTTFSGIGSTSIGFINLSSTNNIINSGITTSLVSVSAASTTSIYSNIQIIDSLTNSMNFVEIYLNTDGNDTYLSEYYFDSNSLSSQSYVPIGSFSGSLSSGVLSLNYTNTDSNTVIVKTKNVGFGSTSVGIGTYRFKLSGQISGTEKTAMYQSNYSTVSAASSIVSVNRFDISGLKSLIEVSVGSTSVLHQVMLLHDNSNIYTLQYPYLSIGSTTGIGTFGGEYDSSGLNLGLKFYPDKSITGNIKVLAYTECLYSDIDTANIPPSLQYGSEIESVNIAQYSGVNGSRINRLDFNLNYNGTPIFQKTFNPSDPTILNPTTGVFSIQDHFFSTGEKLNYIPSSTYSGIGYTAVGIGSTLNSSGILTSFLTPDVYAIKLTNNTFQLATRPDYAAAGIYVTFTSYGLGNAHLLQMNKTLERSIITIDNVIQYPISFTPINYTLYNNGGTVGSSSTIFALSGISSIKPNDLLYVDNEYMKIINVGLGTTSSGPITNSGNVSLVNVLRGAVGSSATSHLDSTCGRIYRGSFNISSGKIHFTDAPIGDLLFGNDSSNLPPVKSRFDGRVYLRKDYSTNQLFDDISSNFTGIGQTYSLTVQGINTTGLGTGGNGVLFINDIYQTPTTANNTGNNFSITQNTNTGITSVIFSGITSDNGSIVQSNYDVNLNQLPRGGVIVSLGSSQGLGYAPLVGANIGIITDAVGRIIGIASTSIFGSGYYGNVAIGISDPIHQVIPGALPAFISASVGAGGSLALTIVTQGDNYYKPTLQIPSPSYTNLPVIGVSRLGVGNTTTTGSGLLLNVNVAPSSTTGIGSTLFEISTFQITRPGYNFQKGDIITPIGLVTAVGLSSPIIPLQLTVTDTFNDSFAAWNFGDLDYIDSVVNLQDGVRTRFPLYYNGSLLSFETDRNNLDSSAIDLNSVLLIFINGVIQSPGNSYQFYGGSSFTFSEPPLPQDNISIYFYRGTRNVDSVQITVYETIKPGDFVQISSNNNLIGITTSQNTRKVFDVSAADKIQTNIYSDVGIDVQNPKPLNWTKQKVDAQINGQIFYKSRDSIESLIYPTAKIIKDFSTSDNQLFVDDANFFKYEQNLTGITISSVNGLIVSGKSDPVSAAVTAIVGSSGTITSLNINSPGSGYIGTTVTVKISRPPFVGVGIGTTATATVTVSNGALTTPITITNPGFGYSVLNPPQAIVALPNSSTENISGISLIQGFSGIITGIGTTTGTSGNPLALKFYLNSNQFPAGLSTGYPIYIYNTTVGNGVTSIDSSNNAIVGIGTSCLNNIYYIHSLNYTGTASTNAYIICNVNSNTSIVGISTVGNIGIGSFSWGRLSGFTRSSSPVSIAVSGSTIDVGLTTFPTIQRRGYGLRSTGAVKNKPYT